MSENEKTFKIEGMDCADCANKIEVTASKVPGVSKAEVSLITSKLKVITRDPSFNYSKIVEAVKNLGYGIEEEDAETSVGLLIEGMDCSDESEVIEKKLSSIRGVKSLKIDLMKRQARIGYDPTLVSVNDLVKAVTETGMKASIEASSNVGEKKGSASSVALHVDGMDCSDESEVIERKLNSVKGVSSLEIDLMKQQVRVSYDPSLVSVQDLVKAVAETGMRASMLKTVQAEKPWWIRNRQVLSLIACGVLTAVGVPAQVLVSTTVGQALFGLAMVVGAYYPAKMGLLALRTLTINIRLLMVVGAIGAVLLGLWEEAALLVLIYSLGDVLEAYSVDRARGAIRALMALSPKEALIRRDGDELMLPTEELRIGDVAIIRPGERIPVDGVVSSGSSFVDQSAITGEPIPVERHVSDEVFAGTINQKGSIEVEVTKLAGDTTLARIIHSVEEAQAKKSSYQRFAERFSRIYTPFMLFLGIAIAVGPPLLLGAPWGDFVYRGLVVLVVSCACGIALSVPVAVVSATANGARKGVLFKGGTYLEVAQEIKALAFDKTGTLTIGRPTVTDVKPLSGLSEYEVIALAGRIESRSEHPLAEAIVRRAKEEGANAFKSVDEFEAVAGKGVKASVGGVTYYVGSLKYMTDLGVPLGEVKSSVSRLEDEGKTVMLLADAKSVLGVIAVADKLRSDAFDTVAGLKAMGLKVVMLTGDNERTAKSIASQVGIDEVLPQLLPEEKVEAVKRLREKYGKVAMVGDGINDAPAMAVADVGIAMGAAGTDIAIETGDIVLMSDDLSRIPYAMGLSRRAVGNIKQNMAISLSLVAILIVTALGGWMGLLPGLILNEVSGLLVIANALRLLR